jgi:hypothetical protein
MVEQKKEGRRYWQEELHKLDKSGLTIADYSRQAGVNSERLYKWRSRFRKESADKAKGFVEVPSSIHAASHIIENYDIYLLPSPHIRIGARFNTERLKYLIEVLRGL